MFTARGEYTDYLTVICLAWSTPTGANVQASNVATITSKTAVRTALGTYNESKRLALKRFGLPDDFAGFSVISYFCEINE